MANTTTKTKYGERRRRRRRKKKGSFIELFSIETSFTPSFCVDKVQSVRSKNGKERERERAESAPEALRNDDNNKKTKQKTNEGEKQRKGHSLFFLFIRCCRVTILKKKKTEQRPLKCNRYISACFTLPRHHTQPHTHTQTHAHTRTHKMTVHKKKKKGTGFHNNMIFQLFLPLLLHSLFLSDSELSVHENAELRGEKKKKN